MAKVFGTKNKREIKAIQPLIAAINDLEPAIQQLSDIDLAAKTIEFKEKLAQGAPLDDLLIEAFAVVREAGRRFLNMRHFDVQLIGGIVLDRGKISEMRTGEGNWSPPCPPTSTRSKARAFSHRHRQRLPGPPRRRLDGIGPGRPAIKAF